MSSSPHIGRLFRFALCMLCLFTDPAGATSLAVEHRDPAPVRVVSLAPNLTELIYDLGLEAHLVGRSSACDFPVAVADIPVIGGFGRPNWEALWAVRPTVVLATDLEKMGLIRQLEERGITVLLLPCEDWDGLKKAAQRIADAVGAGEAGDAWVTALDERIEALAQRTASLRERTPPVRLYVELWGQPITTAGRDSFLSDVIRLAGAQNMGATLAGRYPNISAEWVLREQPDVILLSYMLEDSRPRERVQSRLGWGGLRALREDRIIDSIPADHLLRPGPRLIQGAEALADALLHLFDDKDGL